MRRFILAAALAVGAPGMALAQSADELIAGGTDTGNVINYGMSYSAQRYSTLDQINKDNIKTLVPVWAHALESDQSQESQPMVYKGVIYITTENATEAIDAKTGVRKWKTVLEYDPDTYRMTCCGNMNRGVALYDGKVYRTTLDNRLVAYNAETGEELWSGKSAEIKDGYAMTVAPLVANGVVIIGASGAEYGTRGFLDGYDAETGKKLWRTWTVACPGEPGGDTWPAGDACQHGGGSTWLTGTYDPELDTVYWGTGNPGSWNPLVRPGDNLYTSSVLALNPKTGEIKWHYQFTPNDGMDFDGCNEMVLADIPVNGQTRKVILHADRNAFFYVIDRTNGELIAGNAFTLQDWAKGIDMKTGRPILSDVSLKYRDGEMVGTFPGPNGGKNWSPMSFNPTTGLAYVNALAMGFGMKPAIQEWKAGELYFGVEFGPPPATDEPPGSLRAIEPLTGKSVWKADSDVPRYAGVLTTAGGLVFTGQLTGQFEAFDIDTGKKLWEFQTGSGIEGQPITWEADGVQYIAITNGNGGVHTKFGNNPKVQIVPRAGTLWVFALMK